MSNVAIYYQNFCSVRNVYTLLIAYDGRQNRPGESRIRGVMTYDNVSFLVNGPHEKSLFHRKILFSDETHFNKH